MLWGISYSTLKIEGTVPFCAAIGATQQKCMLTVVT